MAYTVRSKWTSFKDVPEPLRRKFKSSLLTYMTWLTFQRISRNRVHGISCPESWIRELDHLRLKPKHHQKYQTLNGIRRQAAKTSMNHLPIHRSWLLQLESSIRPPFCDQSREGRVLWRHHLQQHPLHLVESKDIPGRPLSRLTPTPTHRRLWRSRTTSSRRRRRPPGRRHRTYEPGPELIPDRRSSSLLRSTSPRSRESGVNYELYRLSSGDGTAEPKICKYIPIERGRWLAADIEARCQILRRARRHLLFRVLRDLESL